MWIMNFVLKPWHLLLAIIAGWVNREQEQVIEYLRVEIQVLREHAGKKRILLTNDQRRRLAVKGKTLGRRRLQDVGPLFAPDTILRWHRELVTRKRNCSTKQKKPGRPPASAEVVELVLRIARENPNWGYDRIQGALANLGHEISDTSIGKLLREHGIDPAPLRKRQSTWRTFLKAHWDVLASIDFTTIEVWTPRGLVTFYVLLAMELNTRRVHFGGCTPNPDAAWVKQAVGELANADNGFLRGKRYLLMDRDTKFCSDVREMLSGRGIEPVSLPPRSPNLNAHLERFIRSLKEECLDRLVFFGEASLRRAIHSFLEHYHTERNHQGLDNRVIAPDVDVGRVTGDIHCRERLGGMLRYYHRSAA
jgi:transposase InsO family protein